MKKVSLFLTSFIASLIFFFGCERDVFTPPTNTENPDDCERVVSPVYFINNLEKPIKIEIMITIPKESIPNFSISLMYCLPSRRQR